MLINQKWLLPFIEWYGHTVHCHTPLGFSGVLVMWYALFVGIPLFCALTVAVFTLSIGYRGIKQGRFPPSGVRVYRPTLIRTGWQSKLQSYCYIFAPVALLMIAVWGHFQVDNMPIEPATEADYSLCDRLQNE